MWLSEVSAPFNKLEEGLPFSGGAAPLQNVEIRGQSGHPLPGTPEAGSTKGRADSASPRPGLHS